FRAGSSRLSGTDRPGSSRWSSSEPSIFLHCPDASLDASSDPLRNGLIVEVAQEGEAEQSVDFEAFGDVGGVDSKVGELMAKRAKSSHACQIAGLARGRRALQPDREARSGDGSWARWTCQSSSPRCARSTRRVRPPDSAPRSGSVLELLSEVACGRSSAA